MRFYTSNNGDWGKVEENSGSRDGGRWRKAAAGGGGRRWPATVGVGAQPKQRKQGKGRGGRAEDGGYCWTPASVAVATATSGGAYGRRQGSGAGDRRRREEAEKEEAGEGGGSLVRVAEEAGEGKRIWVYFLV